MRDSKWFRLLVLALVGAVMFAACGGDDGGDDGGENEQNEQSEDGESSGSVSAEDYVADFCGAMVEWQGAIGTRAGEYKTVADDPSVQPEEKKENLTTYLEDLHGITEDFVTDVEAAGTPDVESGEDIANQFLDGFRQLTGAIEQVQGQVDSLPTDNASAYDTSAQALLTQIQTSFQSIGSTLTQVQSQPIDQAFTDEPACAQIQTAPAG